jgi:hypothetical protein
MRTAKTYTVQILLGVFIIVGASGCSSTQEKLQVPLENNNTKKIFTNNIKKISISNKTQENNSSKEDENLTQTIQEVLISLEEDVQKAKELQEEKIRAKIAKEMKKNVYLDKVQKLMWQDNSAVTKVKKPWITVKNYKAKKYKNTSGDTAKMYCKKLTLVGYSNWRLPTKKELKNLYTQKKSLKNVSSDWYWSSSSNKNVAERAWGVYFNNGDGYSDVKSTRNYVRCVRASKYL